MAIDTNPDVRCEHVRHPAGQQPPAVAFIHRPNSLNGRWYARCQADVRHLADDPDPVPYDVAYLAPGQRRAGTVDDVLADLDDHGYAIVDRNDRP